LLRRAVARNWYAGLRSHPAAMRRNRLACHTRYARGTGWGARPSPIRSSRCRPSFPSCRPSHKPRR
jgi:hypothetical protein